MTAAGIESATASARTARHGHRQRQRHGFRFPLGVHDDIDLAVASASPSAYLPRTLDGLGDNAYIDDVLTTRDSGVHRDITLVFRKANVLVTVEYSQWSTDNSVIPTSPDLQDGARKVAAELAHQLDQ